MEKQYLDKINNTLINGGVIAYVTDTVWGLGCLPNNEKAVKKIYEINGIFIYQVSWLLHLGHLEREKTRLSPLNPLKITTFKKLPQQSPIRIT